jgi:pyrimidine deaminase RibD-like protein
MTSDARSTHLAQLRRCLALARLSPPQPTNFRVGALLMDATAASDGDGNSGTVLAEGYTLELPGNTHAEQSCLLKLAQEHGLPEERVAEALPPAGAVLYTTVEPCNRRLSGNKPCVERILATKGLEGRSGIVRVVVGVAEPGTFVGVNEGRKRLEEAGIEFVHVEGLEEEILEVATAGHKKAEQEG